MPKSSINWRGYEFVFLENTFNIIRFWYRLRILGSYVILIIPISIIFFFKFRVNGQGGQKNGQGSLQSSQCPEQCSRRCSQTRYKKPCMFFCLKCCRACLCVPSGYYGNKGECPCYNNWKTKRGGPKCP
ncbi:Gibberellin-regulated protein [Rhynchospora pubera]|uniref:Gibberellin-regulated protein n=1 Tax=Rhynchospora pubera TaxID=906938 RepID=A0AAV8D1Z1_9POAL|nr:Gibberellin-regulated protein [Rhynchospora pubera]